jgi:hypothetical protein
MYHDQDFQIVMWISLLFLFVKGLRPMTHESLYTIFISFDIVKAFVY